MPRSSKKIRTFPPYIDVFVDTSVYISSFISFTGASHAIFQAIEAGALKLYVSPEIFLEINKVLKEKIKSPALFQRFQSLIESVSPIKVIVSKKDIEEV